MTGPWKARIVPAIVTGLAACASAGPAPDELGPTPHLVTAPSVLPAIPAADGALRIDVVYPPDSAAITARDSTFIFGSTGSGRASLTINGAPVPVAPNGAFLAFLPVPADGMYRIQATKDGETASLEHDVVVPQPPSVPDSGATILVESIEPRGVIAWPAGEPITFRFLGTAGGLASLQMQDGRTVWLTERRLTGGQGRDAANFQRLPGPAVSGLTGVSEYSGTVPAENWVPADSTRGGTALPALGRTASGSSFTPVVRLVANADTASVPVPVVLHALQRRPMAMGVVRPPPGAPADWTIRGRPAPAGPFHWFWPPGTQLELDGEWNGMARVRLARDLSAWVPAADVALRPEGAPLPDGIVSGVRMIPGDRWVDVRIATAARLPHRVDVEDHHIRVTVYGAASAVNFMQYGALDPLIRRAEWSQPADGVFVVDLDLTVPVWGYRAFFDEADALIVRVRRPPSIEPARPLAGLLIAVDPGHPPGGATGPTGLTEAEANLGVALQLKPMLEAAGARVLMLRTDAASVDLGARPRMAAEFNADILVSLHNNAFPDGVNPFENNGTSAYYYQPHSADLARAVQRELLDELGQRDLGIGRADLALVRPTWMPSVLSETLFLMVPEQENALRDPTLQARIARAHVRALERFLAGRAAAASDGASAAPDRAAAAPTGTREP